MVESTAAMARAVTRVVLWRSLIDVMESVTLCAKLRSQEVVDRVLRGHTPLERLLSPLNRHFDRETLVSRWF